LAKGSLARLSRNSSESRALSRIRSRDHAQRFSLTFSKRGVTRRLERSRTGANCLFRHFCGAIVTRSTYIESVYFALERNTR
jgi:hypothetical protein